MTDNVKKAILLRIVLGGSIRVRIIPSIIINGNPCKEIVVYRESKLSASDGGPDELTVNIRAYPIIDREERYDIDTSAIINFPNRWQKTYISGQQGNIIDQVCAYLRSYGYEVEKAEYFYLDSRCYA